MGSLGASTGYGQETGGWGGTLVLGVGESICNSCSSVNLLCQKRARCLNSRFPVKLVLSAPLRGDSSGFNSLS